MYRAGHWPCVTDSESGTMLPLFGGLVFVAFAMIALVVELALLGGAYRTVAGAADSAAEAGASILAAGPAYEGSLEIDGPGATSTAESVARSFGSSTVDVTVQTTDSAVCVTVDDIYLTRTLSFIGVSSIAIGVTSCAEPRSG